MFESYQEIFNKRGAAYHEAMQLAPRARSNEFAAALAPLTLSEGNVICDLPSGGGYLIDYLPPVHRLRYIAVDPSEVFARTWKAEHAEWHLAPLEKLPFETGSIDALVSVAGLHHVETLEPVFAEMRRVLRPGGGLSILEVPAGAITDGFLNEFVDRNNSMGHDGRFIDGPFREALTKAGFAIAHDELCRYTWNFPDQQTMVEYLARMFWLDKTSPDGIADGVAKHLGTVCDERGCRMNWELQSILAR